MSADPDIENGSIWTKRLREGWVLLLLPLALYFAICLWSFTPTDPGWSHAGNDGPIHNLGGPVGAYLADFLLNFFGGFAFVFPVLIVIVAVRLFRDQRILPGQRQDAAWMVLSVAGIVLTGAAIAHLHFWEVASPLPANAGGVIGALIGDFMRRVVGQLGATLFLLAGFLATITLATGLSWFLLMERIGDYVLRGIAYAREAMAAQKASREQRVVLKEREEVRKVEAVKQQKREKIKIEQTSTPPIEKSERAERELQIPLFAALPAGELPPLSLLDEPKQQAKGYSEETLQALSRQVELKLKDFRIEAQVVGAYPGPVITRFEMEPAPGIKGAQISTLDKDIARGLSVQSVRVVDVIPGKSVIGLEIPNVSREIVYLSEILRSKEYDRMSSPLVLALGKDIGGRPMVADLARMPHLLVAGTTGSGKSVAINAMVLSLLYKATAKDVRMLMIDPKMLELSVYQGIPHLLAPVVTDMKEAANGLRWCVAEMERRYKVMAAVGVRNLAGFNKKVKDAEDAGHPLLDPLFVARPDEPSRTAEPLEPLPYIVVFIDEFADMMMIVGKKVEELIARLAQKARAAGIHLILATQRPSVDVITGLIKANIPTRIAFQVSSKIDSRTILDQSGAEQLLGHGDMLYLPPGTAMPERVHGAFVSDDEVHRVVKHLKSVSSTPTYLPGVLDEVQTMHDGQVIGSSGLPEAAPSEGGSGEDELYDQAVRIVTESRRASISGVQRRLKIGYNRAARLIEEMEAQGVVSPPEANGNRQVIAPPPPKD
ncbi:cell division protein FtsK [Ahniella affigens]|uniref:DNA translocase FtsK n=1 Tax=Ahniella affigens TaxID=2021234 RepID=A0A2P1PYR0_9GAMM|nr:cell division protein FtsK [Ahniella affigens]